MDGSRFDLHSLSEQWRGSFATSAGHEHPMKNMKKQKTEVRNWKGMRGGPKFRTENCVQLRDSQDAADGEAADGAPSRKMLGV